MKQSDACQACQVSSLPCAYRPSGLSSAVKIKTRFRRFYFELRPICIIFAGNIIAKYQPT